VQGTERQCGRNVGGGVVTVYVISFTYGGCLRVFTNEFMALEFKRQYEIGMDEKLIFQIMEVI
jgi:hypothetical protein